MRRNQLFSIILILILIVFNLILINKFESAESFIRVLKKDNTDIKTNLYLLKGNQVEQFSSEAMTIKGRFVRSVVDSIIDLKSIIGSGNKLIFRYSELNCQMCVDTALIKLKRLGKQIGSNNIIMISSYSNRKDLYTFKRINELPFEIYNIREGGLGLPIEKQNKPFYFVTDSTLKAKMVFFPEKTLLGLSQEYLDLIKKRFFSSV